MNDRSNAATGGAILAIILMLGFIGLVGVGGLGALLYVRTRAVVELHQAELITYEQQAVAEAAVAAAAQDVVTSGESPDGLERIGVDFEQSTPPGTPRPGNPTQPTEIVPARFQVESAIDPNCPDWPALAVGDGGRLLVAFAHHPETNVREQYFAAAVGPGRSFGVQTLVRRMPLLLTIPGDGYAEMSPPPLPLASRLATSQQGRQVHLGWIEPAKEDIPAAFVVATSLDGGATFGAPQRVHESDGAQPLHANLAADEAGNVVCVWLDKRAGVRQPFASVRLAGKASYSPEVQVYASPEDAGVPVCSPPAVLLTNDGQIHVAFRNQLAGYQDIYVASRGLQDSGDFAVAAPVVASPRWKFAGCCDEGPVLASDGKSLVVGWMDESDRSERLYVAQRPLSGGPFASPQVIDATRQGGQKRLALAFAGETLVAAWQAYPPVDFQADARTHDFRPRIHVAARDPRSGVWSRPIEAITDEKSSQYAPALVTLPAWGEVAIACSETQAGRTFATVKRIRGLVSATASEAEKSSESTQPGQSNEPIGNQ